MKNTLNDLNNYLFEQLERLNDDQLTEEQLEKELKKADGIVKLSTQITNNYDLTLKAVRAAYEFGYDAPDSKLLVGMVQSNG